MDILVQEGPARGLVLSTTFTSPASPKTTVWCPMGLSAPLPNSLISRGVVCLVEEGITLLGSPVGTASHMARETGKKVERVREVTNLLPLLGDPHSEFILLRSCFTLPKLSHTLRTVDTTSMTPILQEFDQIQRMGLSRILATNMDQRSWGQAKLSVNLGGLGVRAAQDHAPVHYCASVLASQPLALALLGTVQGEAEPPTILSTPTLAAISNSMGEDGVTEAELVGVSQKALSSRVDQKLKESLWEGVRDDEEMVKARLQSLSLPHSGNWLNVAPIKSLGLHLRPQEFIYAARYRLGLPIYRDMGGKALLLAPPAINLLMCLETMR